jgi:superfamily II DNA or RNA helicase
VDGFYAGPVGCYGDGAHELAPITVATFESAWRCMAEIGDRFDLLVVDEAHHFGANVRDEALEMALAPARLGLSATPPRDGPAATRLVELLGPAVYELGIGDLAGTFLASFDLFVIGLELAPDERRSYEEDIAKFRVVQTRFWRAVPGASRAEFVRAAASSADGREALAAWRRVRRLLAYTRAKSEAVARLLANHRDAKVLVFTADNETAYALSRRLLVMPLTCDIGRDERHVALRAFREGGLRALVSARHRRRWSARDPRARAASRTLAPASAREESRGLRAREPQHDRGRSSAEEEGGLPCRPGRQCAPSRGVALYCRRGESG